MQNVTHAQRTITNEFSLDNDTSCLSKLKRELMELLADVGKEEPAVPGRSESLARQDRHAARRKPTAARATACVRRRRVRVPHPRVAARGRRRHADRPHDRPHQELQSRRLRDRARPRQRGPGAKIVVEAKEEDGFTLATAREEIETARKNRGADWGLFVFSKKTAPPSLEPFSRYGNDFVVVWDAEDPSTRRVPQGRHHRRPRTLLPHRAQSAAQQVDFEAIDKAILEIEKRAGNLDEVRKSAETIQSSSARFSNASASIAKRSRSKSKSSAKK